MTADEPTVFFVVHCRDNLLTEYRVFGMNISINTNIRDQSDQFMIRIAGRMQWIELTEITV